MSDIQVTVINSIKNLIASDFSKINPGQDNNQLESVRDFLKEISTDQGVVKFCKERLLGPYIYHKLKDFKGNRDISDEVLTQFENEYYLTAVSNIEKLYFAAEIFQAFKKQNVFGIPLKGIAIIETIYKNPAIRPMADIGILIKPGDFQKVRYLLGGLGYQLFESYRGSYNFANSQNKPVLDLHTKFTRYEILFNIDYSEIYRRLHQIKFNDQIKVKVLSPEHQLIHLALHLAPGLYSDFNFINLLDMYYLINDRQHPIDWEYAVDFAEKSETASYVYAPLYLSEKLFHARVPETVLARLGAGLSGKKIDYIQNHHLSAILHKNNSGSRIFFQRLAWAEGISKKLKLLRMALIPERREMAHRYNIPESSPKLYGLYMHRLWKIIKKSEVKSK
jgi:hypothetical protein